MTSAGWLLLTVSCGGISMLVAWCFWRVLHLPHPEKELHTPLDIDTDERA